MQYVKGIAAYQNERPTAITLGKFDGLHKGHDLLVSRVVQYQETENVDGVVFAFDMSPLFQKLNKEPDFLLSNEEKAALLEGRVAYFVDCPFDDEIEHMEAEDFIRDVLVERFHAKHIVVGTDFRFGHQKRGDFEMLRRYEQTYGYQVDVIDKIKHQDREISSTYIKEELRKGNLEMVDFLLGYKYSERNKKHFDNA
jgi:riboflavin kinase/FMN adenylyltransferase